jgi:hypothetical protein
MIITLSPLVSLIAERLGYLAQRPWMIHWHQSLQGAPPVTQENRYYLSGRPDAAIFLTAVSVRIAAASADGKIDATPAPGPPGGRGKE